MTFPARFAACLIAFGLAVFLPGAGLRAHPHVWVTGTAAFHLENGALTRLSQRWQFDAFFSQVLMGDFDKNHDGTLDEAETAAMKAQVFGNLKEYGYFTHLRIGTTALVLDQVENFHTDLDNGELVFFFDLVLAKPVDMKTNQVSLALFDPTIYVDIALGGDKPVSVEGAGALKCKSDFRSLDQMSNSQGFVSPQEVLLSCGG